jgi:hypothetical protein
MDLVVTCWQCDALNVITVDNITRIVIATVQCNTFTNIISNIKPFLEPDSSFVDDEIVGPQSQQMRNNFSNCIHHGHWLAAY